MNSSKRGAHSISSGLQRGTVKRLHSASRLACVDDSSGENRHFSRRLAAAATTGVIDGDLGDADTVPRTCFFAGFRSTQSSSSANTSAGASARSGLCIFIGEIGLVTSSNAFVGSGSQIAILSLDLGDGARRSTTGWSSPQPARVEIQEE